MSFQAMTWALKQKLPTPHERWILVAIANYANEDFEAWPSKAKIADDTGYSQSTVCKYLAVLEEAGIISIVERFVDGAQTTSAIKLMASPPDGPPVRETDTLSARRKKGVRATDNPCPPHGHKPITEPIIEPDARAGACETGASPARAEGPRTSIVLRRGDKGWTTWLEHLPAHLAEQAEEAGAIEVPFRFPGRDSQLISLVRTNGVFEQPVGTAAAKPPAGGRVQPSLSVCRGDASWADWMAEIGPEKAAKAEIAGEIAVTARWPKRDGARFIGVVAPGGGA